jgi:broad specificity phosphatase PhoE
MGLRGIRGIDHFRNPQAESEMGNISRWVEYIYFRVTSYLTQTRCPGGESAEEMSARMDSVISQVRRISVKRRVLTCYRSVTFIVDTLRMERRKEMS